MSEEWKREIAEVRNAFAELESFLNKVDEEIAANPDDPRDGLFLLPGLDRLIFLIPCVIKRLEDDIKKENADIIHIKEGLAAITEGIKGILAYYAHDNLDGAVDILNDAVSEMTMSSSKGIHSHIRLFLDVLRIMPDFHIILNMLEEFQETRKRRSPEPEDADAWSAERWFDYYREQARREEPLISFVEAEGLSEESLNKGMKKMVHDSQILNMRMGNNVWFNKIMTERDAAFDSQKPESFLDLHEIPELEEKPDNDYEDIILGDENESAEPWANSLPELNQWEKRNSESAFSGDDLSYPKLEEDPVYQILNPFVHNLIDILKKDYDSNAKKDSSGNWPMRICLDNYLAILALKAQVRISSCEVWVESAGNDAPKTGVYMFATECLEKIACAIEKFAPDTLRPLIQEARNAKKQIENIISTD